MTLKLPVTSLTMSKGFQWYPVETGRVAATTRLRGEINLEREPEQEGGYINKATRSYTHILQKKGCNFVPQAEEFSAQPVTKTEKRSPVRNIFWGRGGGFNMNCHMN